MTRRRPEPNLPDPGHDDRHLHLVPTRRRPRRVHPQAQLRIVSWTMALTIVALIGVITAAYGNRAGLLAIIVAGATMVWCAVDVAREDGQARQ